jgi:adenosine deaminase
MIDLHHHFDGAFEINSLYAEARRRNLPQGKLSAAEFHAKCQVPADCRTLTEFLAVFDFFYDIAQDVDFLHNEAKKLPARMTAGGVIYLETRFAPHLFTGKNYAATDIVESVVSGLESGSGTPVRLILCAMRNAPLEQVEELRTLYQKFAKRGVCGIDLAGDESRYACREYSPVFKCAHEQGIPITIHAGEASGPQSVYDALDLFKARRIGHGIQSVQDASLVRRLTDEKIGLEVCLTSNLQTGNAASYQEHPFLRLKQAGVLVTLNTDDPTVSGIDLQHEWTKATAEYGFSPADKKALLMNSIAVAFCDQDLKEKLRKQVEAA